MNKISIPKQLLLFWQRLSQVNRLFLVTGIFAVIALLTYFIFLPTDFDKGESALKNKQWTVAIQFFSLIQPLDGKYALAQEGITAAKTELCRPILAEAQKNFTNKDFQKTIALLEHFPGDVTISVAAKNLCHRAKYEIALKAIEQKDYQQAIAILSDIPNDIPLDVEGSEEGDEIFYSAQYEIAKIYGRQGKFSDALSILNYIPNNLPFYSQVHNLSDSIGALVTKEEIRIKNEVQKQILGYWEKVDLLGYAKQTFTLNFKRNGYYSEDGQLLNFATNGPGAFVDNYGKGSYEITIRDGTTTITTHCTEATTELLFRDINFTFKDHKLISENDSTFVYHKTRFPSAVLSNP